MDGLQSRCDRLFVETLSAVRPQRPIYDSVVQSLRPGDTLVVWDLDRAFRSVIDAITQAERLRAKGVQFEIANLQVDTATPAGMLVYTVMSACAEFERRMLIQRTKEGLEAARRRGKRLGRPPKLTASQLSDARHRLSMTEDTIAQMAKDFGVAPWTLTRALQRWGDEME
jgi:DNA invertase Pin-like site-specific DNA recombinase